MQGKQSLYCCDPSQLQPREMTRSQSTVKWDLTTPSSCLNAGQFHCHKYQAEIKDSELLCRDVEVSPKLWLCRYLLLKDFRRTKCSRSQRTRYSVNVRIQASRFQPGSTRFYVETDYLDYSLSVWNESAPTITRVLAYLQWMRSSEFMMYQIPGICNPWNSLLPITFQGHIWSDVYALSRATRYKDATPERKHIPMTSGKRRG